MATSTLVDDQPYSVTTQPGTVVLGHHCLVMGTGSIVVGDHCAVWASNCQIKGKHCNVYRQPAPGYDCTTFKLWEKPAPSTPEPALSVVGVQDNCGTIGSVVVGMKL